MKIVLPLAPAINSKFVSRSFRPNPKFAAFKEEARLLLLKHKTPIPMIGGKSPKTGKKIKKLTRNVLLKIDLYEGLRRDIDASEKVIQDVLQGFLYEDDWQIKKKITEIHYDEKNPRVEIEVVEIDA